MADPTVWVFFYGSYMNFAVLREVDLLPAQWEVARLHGVDIRIQPRANLVPDPSQCVYGILATATHAELNRLYAHAMNVLGEVYLPHPVLGETLDGRWRPALCYICPQMKPHPATSDYIDRIVQPARENHFPARYIDRLESYRS